jgi:predicted metal-binding protein
MFVSLVYCAESTVRWFVVREKHCWMAADSADKSKRTGRSLVKAFYGVRSNTFLCGGALEDDSIELTTDEQLSDVVHVNSCMMMQIFCIWISLHVVPILSGSLFITLYHVMFAKHYTLIFI